jgi:hypothetical protein
VQLVDRAVERTAPMRASSSAAMSRCASAWVAAPVRVSAITDERRSVRAADHQP